MFTVREAADKLSVSPNVIYREIARRRLRCYHFGGAIRISEQQLNDYMEGAESRIVTAPREYKHVSKLGG